MGVSVPPVPSYQANPWVAAIMGLLRGGLQGHAMDVSQREHTADRLAKQQAAELAQRRQATLDESTLALNKARVDEAVARSKQLLAPKVTPPVRREHLIGEDGSVVFYDPTNPALPEGFRVRQPSDKEPQDHFTFPTGTDENGNPIVLRANTRTGAVDRTDVGRPTAGGGGAAGMTDARIATAAAQAADADRIMTQFENDYMAGKASLSTSGIALAKIALHGGPVQSAAAEASLNKINPELANYVRAAKAVATAERLITPRGGSNALMQAEGMLSAAGAHANPAQIDQARKFRRGLLQGLQSHGKPKATPQDTTAQSPSPFADLVPPKP